MKFLLLLGLLIVSTIACEPGLREGTVNCYCECNADGTEACKTKADMLAAYRNQHDAILGKFIHYCASANEVLKTCEQSGGQLVNNNDLLTSEQCVCPICDFTAKCDAFTANIERYGCYEANCYEKECDTFVADNGNVLYHYQRSSVAVANDASHCSEICSISTVSEPLPTAQANPCDGTTNIIVSTDGCFRKCETNPIDGMTRIGETTDAVSVTAEKHEMMQVLDAMKTYNPQLNDCPYRSILPRDGECGLLCIDTCTAYNNRIERVEATDNCIKYTCTEYDAIEEYTASVSSNDTDTESVTFANVRKEISTEEALCATLHAQLAEENKLDVIADTECVLGDIRVSDRYTASSSGPFICKCITDPNSVTNSIEVTEVCDTMERNFPNLRELCVDRLKKDGCIGSRVYYNSLPKAGLRNTDICSYLYCDTLSDPNDVNSGAVCRMSAQGFVDNEGTPITDKGCYFNVCDEETGELISKQYDIDISLVPEILDICPGLIDCETTSVDTGGSCGQCPVCADTVSNINACNRDTFRRKESACHEIIDNIENIAGRIKLENIGIRMCLNELNKYTRSEIYKFMRISTVGLSNTCNVPIDNIQPYVTEFDYRPIDKLSTDPNICNTMILVTVTVELTSDNREKLNELMKCLNNLSMQNILQKIRDSFVEGSKFIRLKPTDDALSGTAIAVTNDDGISATVAEPAMANTQISLFDASGENEMEFDVVIETTYEGGNRINIANHYTIIIAVIASFIAVLIY